MLTKLKDIVREINQQPSLEEALECVSRRLVEVFDAQCCSIYLADHEQQHFRLAATEGLATDAVGRVRIPFSEGLIGLIGQREEPINVADAQAHPRFKHYPDVQEEHFHAFLGTPIIHQRRVLGVITVQHTAARKFSEQEEALLVTLAVQMALEIVTAEARGALVAEPGDDTLTQSRMLRGIPGSTGVAMGVGTVLSAHASLRDLIPTTTADVAAEIERFRAAVAATRSELAELTKRIEGDVPPDVAAIFQLYDMLLDAASLGREVEQQIAAGWSAASGLKWVAEGYRKQFARMTDAYLRERAIDVEDLSNRVLAHLQERPRTVLNQQQKQVLVADVVTPSMLAEYSSGVLIGIVSLRGASNSHMAILARAMGIPAVVGIANVPLSLFADRPLVVDGYAGKVHLNPTAKVSNVYSQLLVEEQQLETEIQAYADQTATTTNQQAVALLINAGLSYELDTKYLAQGDGVGLYRTEIPFMQQERFPSEAEQVSLYRKMLRAYPDKTVAMRTLDVGGDKPLAYMTYAEDNPFLGWRGIRITLDHPEIFIVQVRAMLRASAGYSNLQIILPMIASVGEVSQAKRLIRQAYYEVNEEVTAAGQVLYRPKVGVMIEVPSTIFQLPQLARIVDFFSIGSNDLTQYLLAVDRNNSRVSGRYDSLHPSVLAALHTIVQQAKQHGIPTTVCGEIAADPAGMILLLAMGYRRLSMNGHDLAKAKWVINLTDTRRAEILLTRALNKLETEEVREMMDLELENMGLGGLVRAGK